MNSGKIVWLTGASSGIGRCLAEQLLQAGNQVIASARNIEGLADLVARYPHLCTPLACDIADDASMLLTQKKLRNLTDTLDLLILNAGTCEYVDPPEIEPKLFHRVFRTNVQGAVNCLSIALPLMPGRTSPCTPRTSNNKPLIVAVSSLSTLLPFPRAEAYGASKAALEYLMACLRVDLLSSAIDVTVVQPGFVQTPLTAKNDFPMPGLITPERAAQEILWAIDKRKKIHRFPKRLAWPLLWLRGLGGVWAAFIAPRLSRKSNALY